MEFQKGFCRIETKEQIVYGEITEIRGNSILFIDFAPFADEIIIAKKDIIEFEPVNEEDIPPYE